MISIHEDAQVLTVTLDRAEKANSLTEGMLNEIAQIAQDAALRTDLTAFILTGAGTRVFSAGADLEEAKTGLTTSLAWDRASSAIAALPCLSIAALNGTVAGGAFGVALACDIRICVQSAKFFYPVAMRGYRPQKADPARMIALMGPARTKYLLMTARKIDAATAYQWGLVEDVADDLDALKAKVSDLLEVPKEASCAHLKTIKDMCAR